MANIAGIDLGGLALPGTKGFFSGFGASTLEALLYFMVIAALGVVVFLYYNNKKYRYKIKVFENVGGSGYTEAGNDRAKLIRMGDGGEMILFLKKRKVHRTAYGKKMGTNTYWFAIGQDGYWYNCVLGDLDAKQGMLDIEPIDRDMRYMHVAIRKNIQDRYRKDKFMDKFGGWVLAGVFMIIMFLGIWFLISKMGDSVTALNEGVRTSVELMNANKDILTALNNLVSNSGATSV